MLWMTGGLQTPLFVSVSARTVNSYRASGLRLSMTVLVDGQVW